MGEVYRSPAFPSLEKSAGRNLVSASRSCLFCEQIRRPETWRRRRRTTRIPRIEDIKIESIIVDDRTQLKPAICDCDQSLSAVSRENAQPKDEITCLEKDVADLRAERDELYEAKWAGSAQANIVAQEDKIADMQEELEWL